MWVRIETMVPVTVPEVRDASDREGP